MDFVGYLYSLYCLENLKSWKHLNFVYFRKTFFEKVIILLGYKLHLTQYNMRVNSLVSVQGKH